MMHILRSVLVILATAPALLLAGSQQRIVIQTGHTAQVNAVDVDARRTLVASASNDHSVRLWKISAPSTGTLLRVFSGHTAAVQDVEFNVNDEQQLASCALDQTVRLWHLDRNEHTRIDLRTDAGCLAYQPRSNILAVGLKDTPWIEFYDANNGQATDRPVAVNAPVRTMTYAADGDALICGLESGSVIVLDTRTKKIIHATSLSDRSFVFADRIGTMVLTVDRGGVIFAIREDRLDSVHVQAGIRAATLNATRDTLIAVTDDAMVVRIATGSLHTQQIDVGASSLDIAVQNKDGMLLVHGQDAPLEFTWWLQPRRTDAFVALRSASRVQTTVAFSPMSDMIAIGDNRGALSVFGLDRPLQITFPALGFARINTVAWSDDGSRLFVGGFGRRAIVIINTNTWHVQHSIDTDKSIEHIQPTSGEHFTYVDGLNKDYHTVEVTDSAINDVYVRHAQLAATSPAGGRTVLLDGPYLWSESRGVVRGAQDTLPGPLRSPRMVTALACGDARSDVYLAVAGEGLFRFDLETHRLSEPTRLSDDATITSMVVSGSAILAGCDDGTVRILDRTTMKPIDQAPWRDHAGQIRSIAVSQDGSLFASASNDGTVVVRQLGSPAEIKRIVPMGEDWAVLDTHDHFDGTPGALRSIHVVEGLSVLPLDGTFETDYAPGLLAASPAPRIAVPYVPMPSVSLQLLTAAHLTSTPTVRVDAELYAALKRSCTVHVFTNEKLRSRRPVQVRGDVTSLALDVALTPGTNLVRLRVEVARGIVVEDTVTIVYEPVRPVRSKLFIVSVGINAYANNAYTLSYARQDAVDVAHAVALRPTKDVDIDAVTLTDADATKEKILAALDRVAQTAQPHDALMFFFAGHGAVAVQGDTRTFCLVPTDVTDTRSAESLLTSAITADTLRAMLLRIPCQRQAVMMDACYSGGMVETPTSIDNARFMASLQRATGATILASVPPTATAKEVPSLQHGVFTYAVLQGLSGAAQDRDGDVTVLGLLNYLTKEVPALSRRLGLDEQQPVVRFEGAAQSFVLR